MPTRRVDRHPPTGLTGTNCAATGGYLSPSASQAMEALEAILRKER